jgi:hypothetical protein
VFGKEKLFRELLVVRGQAEGLFYTPCSPGPKKTPLKPLKITPSLVAASPRWVIRGQKVPATDTENSDEPIFNN